MSDDMPHRYWLCCPCEPSAYWRHTACAPLPGWECALCMAPCPPVTPLDVEAAIHARFSCQSGGSYGSGYGHSWWKSSNPYADVTLMWSDDGITLYVYAAKEGARWSLAGAWTDGVFRLPLAEAIDRCEAWLRERGVTVPFPEDESEASE